MARTVISSAVRTEIEKEIKRIEADKQVRVFYACESGSRAWGFESQNSDYDVRFLYARKADWYMSIDVENRRDVIERPISDELDVSGWDIRKALKLLRKSNPPLLEWLQSPIIYREEGTAAESLRQLMRTCYSPRASMYHYLNMARGNAKDFLRGGKELRYKKYFYILRPLLAVRWIEAGSDADLRPVPMEFQTLLDRFIEPASSLRADIDELLVRKRAGSELGAGPQIDSISAFIETEIARIEDLKIEVPGNSVESGELDRVFREIVG